MGTIIDKNGRLFGKVSVIDLFVVLLVAVMAFALHVKTNRLAASSTAAQSNTPITFTVLAENVSPHVADALRVGDKLYDKDRASGGSIAAITSIERQPAGITVQLRSGGFVRVGSDNGVNLLITAQGSGSVNNGRYALNRVYELGVNAARNFYTNYAFFVASVTEIH